jgi:hypothetical protein
MWVGEQRYHPAALPPGKTRYPLYWSWMGPGPVWTGTENLAPTGVRSPNRPARSESVVPYYNTLQKRIWEGQREREM